MELEFDELGQGYRFDILEDAASRVDGARAWKEGGAGVLYCDNEDAVWNVWRAAGRLEDKFRDDGVESMAEDAVAVQDAIEELFG